MDRRSFLVHAGGTATAAAAGALFPMTATARTQTGAGDLLGQGAHRFRVVKDWGRLDPAAVPVKDCHAITQDRAGRIVLLTNDVRNNVIVYTTDGAFVSKREDRFPGAHALEFRDDGTGDERLWITDHALSVISLCDPTGRELRRLEPAAVASRYEDISKYHATNVAVMPDGSFFVSDGYGSHFIHHFDPDWKLVATFGGAGDGPEHLKQPHAVWLDTRQSRPELLVCDRANERLKWFSPAGELLKVVPLPGAQPSNIAAMAGNHIAIASLNGMILILDGDNRVVSVIGGRAPAYVDGQLQPLTGDGTTFTHPHDVYADAEGALYVAQWNSGRTYPIKLAKA